MSRGLAGRCDRHWSPRRVAGAPRSPPAAAGHDSYGTRATAPGTPAPTHAPRSHPSSPPRRRQPSAGRPAAGVECCPGDHSPPRRWSDQLIGPADEAS
eukprot:scaffold35227_cov46-Phaeocystis_antarctica.AAC.8